MEEKLFPGRTNVGMAGHFYDKVTRKFGTFSDVPKPLADYSQGNPEVVFEQKLIELSGKDKAVKP